MSKQYDQAIVAFARGILRWRYLVLATSILAVAGLMAGGQRLSFSSHYSVYFGVDNPQRVAFETVQDIYTKNDNTLVAIEPPGDTVFNPDTLALVAELTQRAWELPFSLRVDSIANYQHTEADGDDLRVADLVPEGLDLTPEALLRIEQIAVNEPLLVNRLISTSGHITAVNITNEYPGEAQSEVSDAVAAVRELRDELLAKYPGHKIYMTGSNMMNNAFTEASQADMKSLYPVMYLVLILILFVLLRSVTATVATVLVIAASAGGAMGLAGWLGFGLTPPSVAAPVVITTLAVADSVHVLVTMFANMRQGMDKQAALVESMRLNFTPILLTSITTALGFLTINFTDSPPLRDLGNISAMGTMLAWALSVTLLPALMAILPVAPPKKTSGLLSSRMESFGQWVTRHNTAVLIVSGLIAIGLLALVPSNRDDEMFAHYFDERIQYRTDTDYIVDNLTGLYTMKFSLESRDGIADPAYLAKLEEFADFWRADPRVLHVSTITEIFKRLNKNMHGDDPAWYRLPEERNLAAQYLLLYEFSLPFGLDLNNTINLDKSASRFTVVFEHLTAKENRDVVETARQWLDDNAPSMSTTGVSPAVMFAYIAKRNFESMAVGIPVALVGISLILLLALRSVKLGLLSLIPNLLPLGMAFGLWALYDGTLNFTMAFALGMVMGVIVDDTIHFMSKYLRARRELGLEPEAAIVHSFRTVGVALLVTSLVLVCGFFVLSTSSFLPNYSLSMLTIMAIVSALAADFFLLPALLLRVDRGKPQSETPPHSDKEEPAYV